MIDNLSHPPAVVKDFFSAGREKKWGDLRKFLLTFGGGCVKIILACMGDRFGEVSERFKEPVLKTGDSVMGHGFESHPLRHTA